MLQKFFRYSFVTVNLFTVPFTASATDLVDYEGKSKEYQKCLWLDTTYGSPAKFNRGCSTKRLYQIHQSRATACGAAVRFVNGNTLIPSIGQLYSIDPNGIWTYLGPVTNNNVSCFPLPVRGSYQVRVIKGDSDTYMMRAVVYHKQYKGKVGDIQITP